jgi:hypothetical protein
MYAEAVELFLFTTAADSRATASILKSFKDETTLRTCCTIPGALSSLVEAAHRDLPPIPSTPTAATSSSSPTKPGYYHLLQDTSDSDDDSSSMDSTEGSIDDLPPPLNERTLSQPLKLATLLESADTSSSLKETTSPAPTPASEKDPTSQPVLTVPLVSHLLAINTKPPEEPTASTKTHVEPQLVASLARSVCCSCKATTTATA